MIIRYIKNEIYNKLSRHEYIELVNIAVKQNGLALKYIDREFHTDEIINYAIDNNQKAILYIDQTEELCYNFIEKYPNIIEYIKNPTREMYRLAIKKNPQTIRFNKFRYGFEEEDKELCMIALNQDPSTINWIPKGDDFPTNHMYENILEKDGLLLRYIPFERRTHRMKKIALKQNGLALQYINDQISSFLGIKYLSRKMEELYEIAITQNGLAIQYVKYKYPKLCEMAIKQNLRAILYIDTNIKKYLHLIIKGTNEKYDDVCSLCLDTLNYDVYKTECNHYFHANCLIEVVSKKVIEDIKCPLCQKNTI